MIKHFKKVKPPEVELSNLTFENCSEYDVKKDPTEYPIAHFAKRKGETGAEVLLTYDSPEDCPKGYQIWTQYDTPKEALLDYAQKIKEEFDEMTDDELSKRRYIGRGKEARRIDELKRRGLVSK